MSWRELSQDDPRHGKYTTYTNYECRCAKCRAAWAAFKRELRRKESVREAAEETNFQLPLR